MDETLTIELTAPIEHNGNRYDRIVVREPTMGELIAAQKKPVAEQGIYLIAAAANIHPVVVEKLPVSKFRQAQVFIESFLADGQTAG